jgi:glucose-1-phosphate cytidylyltransferase
MLEIGGRPILWHIMRHYASAGIKDFVLCLGYRGDAIRRYFLDYRALHSDFTVSLGNPDSIRYHGDTDAPDWNVTLAETGLNAMTGARVKRVARYITDDDFLLTYGDGLSNVDLKSLVLCHHSHGKIGTVTGVRPPSRFGELQVRGARVRKFSEKPQTSAGFINGGYFVFNRRFFDYLDDDDSCVLEGKPLERLAEDGELMVYRHDGYWQPVDTPREFDAVNALWESGRAPWA